VLMNLFVPAVESPLPLAVVDAEERLVGVIPRITLLAALGPGPNSTEEITLPMPPVSRDEIAAVLGEADAAVTGASATEGEVR
jgi:glycine betaine/proline transport system ATP-binding protein